MTALIQGIVDIAVTGRVPTIFGVVGVLGNGQGGVLFDTRETALLEGDNVDIAILVFTDDFHGFGFGVEGIHEKEG